jgi:quercetin dioxygenase-like cupin family protein
MRRKAFWVLLAAAAAAGVSAATVLATNPGGQSTTTYAKATVGPLDLKAKAHPASLWRARLRTHGLSDFYVVDNKFAVGGTTGWHSHPGPSLIFVVAGQITNYHGDDPTCTPHVYTAGQAFTDEGGADVHMLRNEGTVQAETIAVQFVPKDAVRRIDEPDPGYCHFGG